MKKIEPYYKKQPEFQNLLIVQFPKNKEEKPFYRTFKVDKMISNLTDFIVPDRNLNTIAVSFMWQ